MEPTTQTPNKITNKKVHRRRGTKSATFHQVARDPYIDWVIVFSCFLTLTVILLAVGVYVYLRIGHDFSVSDSSQTNSPIIDTNQLTNILKEYDNRAAKRSDILGGYYGSSDPAN